MINRLNKERTLSFAKNFVTQEIIHSINVHGDESMTDL